MSIQQRGLSQGRWFEFSLIEQLANIDSEIERALNWEKKGNKENGRRALDRALELMDFTLEDPKNVSRLRELARLRDDVADYFAGENRFCSSEDSLRRYFSAFAYAARKDR
ncbi:MAG: hypothetical protein JW803_08930 [Endomicrobiales bacterium]|nr:hypothetical protein [Endomicrobiales bacterium]